MTRAAQGGVLIKGWALSPEVMADADERCLAAFGRAEYWPGLVVVDNESKETGTVLGPYRVSTGVMLAVDFGGWHPECRWARDVEPVQGLARTEPPRLYVHGSGSAVFWHEGFEYLVWRTRKGAHSWDVFRKGPGGSRVDERWAVVQGVRGRKEDAWETARALLDEARRECPSPYEADRQAAQWV